MSQFRIALAQVESQIGTETYDPRPDNFTRAERAVTEAAAKGADLVLFGEMFLTGYHTDEWNPLYALHVDQPDPTIDQLAALAATQRHRPSSRGISTGDLPPMRLRNACQCPGSNSGCVIAKCAPASTLARNRAIS